MKTKTLVASLAVIFVIVSFAAKAHAGATLTVNWVGPGNNCDSVLTLEEAALLGEGTMSRALSTAEKNQVSGATFVPALPGPCGASLWLATAGVGINSADDIVFASGMTVPINASISLGQNDDIDGTTGTSKIILDGTGLGSGYCGIYMSTFSGSQIRNMEIRNFPACGIHAFATSGAIFEGLDIHNNGTYGIDLGYQSGSPTTNSRNTRIGGDQPQHRNRIYANGASGIRIESSPVGDRFPDQGIDILNNLIGTSDGVTDNGNGGPGITLINTIGVVIGDTGGTTKNVISGNNSDGISIIGAGAVSNRIIWNNIGTNESGGGALGNSLSGVAFSQGAGDSADFINSTINRVGLPGFGNVISSNGGYGIYISDTNTSNNVIQSNLIGTNPGGNSDLGNALAGIYFGNGTYDNQAGGTGAGEGNLIAFNALGIKADAGIRNAFRRNRMFSNDGMGIDLAPAGVTPNDAGDGDSGPNNLQNFPVITYVNAQASSVSLSGTLNSTPNQAFTLEFFGNDGVDSTGYGEGRYFLGATTVNTNAAGNATFTGLNFTVARSNVSSWVTATATDVNGNTSEFSLAKNACGNMLFSPTDILAPLGGGPGNFTVIYSSGCSSYSAQSNVAWINVTSVLGGTVNYTVAANPSPPRDGLINITYNNGTGTAVQSFLISQNNGCTYPLSHSTASYPASGTPNDGMSVGTGAGCQWTAASNAAWITVSSGTNYTGPASVTWAVSANTGPARQGTLTIAGQTFTINQAAPSTKTPFDFDGDKKTDISIFRPGPGEWWYLKSSNGGNYATQFGTSTDRLVASDLTGDGKADIAFWRPSTGMWFVLRSEDSTFYSFPFGSNGDIPTPADFDGDGKADAAVFRPATATWYISKSTGGTTIQQFGLTGDQPVAADYDGDSKADIAVWRASLGQWWWIKSSNGSSGGLQFGNPTDKAVVGDYTGDGKADFALWRPSTGFWFILRSEDFSFYSFPFGSTGDTPSPGDYDGDGKFDAAVFRPSTATWYASRSTAGTLIQQFGIAGDQPVPNAFVR